MTNRATNDIPRVYRDSPISNNDHIAKDIKKRGEEGKYLRDKVVEEYKVSKGKWV